MLKKGIDTVFTARAIKSRNSYMIWIPKTEAELLELQKGTLMKIGVSKIRKTKNK